MEFEIRYHPDVKIEPAMMHNLKVREKTFKRAIEISLMTEPK